ncbi:MAG: DUF4868 domain-containing protein [Eubacterium sp.]|nr:DUF4868 domain-containing protein [Eubacterium sp.]
MTVSQMQSIIKGIINNEFGLTAFAVLKTDDGFAIKKFIIDDNLNNRVKELFKELINNAFLAADFELDSADNIADNRKVCYEIVQDDNYSPFSFLNNYSSITEAYSEDDLKNINGLAFRINLNDKAIWVYQHITYSQLVKRSNNIYAIFQRNNVYTSLTKDILKIENKIDCLIIGDSIITANISLLQRCFQFEEYTRREAEKTISVLSEMGIVDNLDCIAALGEKTRLTYAKKLMKARNSPVLRMDKEVLFDKLKKLPRYKNKWEFSDGKIKIANQQQASEFIKMLNDSILKSELTDAEYDSSVKTELEPLK